MTLWRELIDSKIETICDSSEDKLCDLKTAISRHVRPGMKINPCSLQARPHAAVYEICRQFAGTKPEFEYIASTIGNVSISLVRLGLLKKAVVSFAAESYPTPGPSREILRALRNGTLEIENWSMLTISQRLLAGAMGVPYFPTRSLAESTIGEELKRDGLYVQIDDPSNPGEQFGMLKAYRPDISFVHAWAADRSGNAVCYPPYGENVYGALGAREGTIVTADHIVSTDFIREHANLVRVPAAVVRAVSHVPYGCHPFGNFAQSIDDLRVYGNDYEFMQEFREASLEEDTFDQWIQDWILDTEDHAGYVRKLGQERIDYLHHVAEPDSWRSELETQTANLSEDLPPSPIETMIVHGSRLVARRIRDNGYKTILSGVGQSTLMSWLAAHQLRGEGLEVTMMAETGLYGHDPRPSDPFVFNFRNLPTTTVLTDIFETLGLHTGGASNQCLGTFGAGEVDRRGNVNSTRGADGGFIVGSGGANDIASAACETVVVAQQRSRTFVDEVHYITSPGRHVSSVVSTMGCYEKRGGDELILTGYIPVAGLDRDAVVARIKEYCAWDLQVADDLEELSPPTVEELTLLRVFDPQRFFLGKAVEAATPKPVATT